MSTAVVRASASAGAGLAALLVLGAAVGAPVLVVPVLGTQVLLAVGWHRAVGAPGRLAGAGIAVTVAAGADALVVAGAGEQPLSAVAGLLALAVPAALVQQLARVADRSRVRDSLSATVVLSGLAVLGCGWLAAAQLADGTAVVAAGGLGVAGGSAATALRSATRLPAPAVLALGGVLALAGGGAVAGLHGDLVVAAPAVALAAALLAAAGVLLAERAPERVLPVAAALPVLLAGPAVHVLGRLLGA